MGQRSEVLAAQYEQVLSQLEEAVRGCSDQKWSAICGDEGWTVAATAHHLGAQLPLEKEYLVAAAEGMQMPAYSWDDINARNAKHAQEFSAAGKADTLEVIRTNGSAMAAWVRGLSDEQTGPPCVPLALAGGAQVTTQQLIEGGVKHPRGRVSRPIQVEAGLDLVRAVGTHEAVCYALGRCVTTSL